MCAGKLEAGLGVIKAQRAFPGCGGMAILAIPTQLAAMGILPGVATGAIAGQPPVLMRRAMAGRAGDALVRTGKRIFGKRVIERCPVELDQAEPAPPVLRMATLAGAGSGRSKLAVKMGTLRNIGTDTLVARGAARILRRLAERCVAAVAMRLKPRVHVRERAGSYQALHQRLRQNRGGCQQQHEPEKAQEQAHQYICTATIWRIAAATNRMNKGRCSKCHNRSSRSKNANSAARRTAWK